MLMELNNILDIFWTVRIETAFPNVNQYECLVSIQYITYDVVNCNYIFVFIIIV